MRNPPWTRDELILALDLYMKHNPIHISQRHPEVIALSEALNSLPIHKARPSNVTFRNPNGVYMKLCNFLRLDPSYSGKGLEAGSKLEQEIWNEFQSNPQHLDKIASSIRASVRSAELPLLKSEVDDEDEAAEGKILSRLHRVRERNWNLINRKKSMVLASTGRLSCEVCLFDFESRYGPMGKGFIECHHTIPLSNLAPSQKTRLADLALVCPNCHRMLHKGSQYMSIDELKSVISS